MESPDHWVHFGPGQMTFTGDRFRDGRQSVRLTSPTRTATPPPVQGRPFGETGVRREFDGADWSDFNRLSVWVYPDLPGFRVVSLLLKLNSEGTQGRSYTDGAMNFVLLTNQTWNQVVWEIPHLGRKQVRSLDLIYRLQGNEPEATNQVSFDFDQLELQRVESDHFRGWDVAPGGIAYCHEGYTADAPKRAFLAGPVEGAFQVVDDLSGAVCLERPLLNVRTSLGAFGVLDFSDFRQLGTFRLRAGGIETKPFRVVRAGDEPALWQASLDATLDLFRGERCGGEVPGIHGVCHRDWQVKHGDQRIVINGGWHDAGDLSQGLVNTSEAAWSMLRLVEEVRRSRGAEIDSRPDDARPPLVRFARQMQGEARWGIDWMLKTRFGDGHRVTWATMDFWTDGILGNQDDVVVESRDSAFENFLAAAAEAVAGRVYRDSDPIFAAYCVRAAEADWRLAREKVQNPGVELAAAGAQASVELFRTTQRSEFAEEAVRLAEVLLASQQLETPAWEVPMTGFFHTSPKQDRFLHYNHRSHEQAPVVVLADLCEALPEAPERERWKAAVRAYGDFLLAGAKQNEPWRMIPAGIYRVSDTGNAFEKDQIQQGVRLAEGVHLRRFPVWGDFRGNLGVQLSQATAAARAGRLLDDAALRDLAREQLEWTLGRNPFCQSLMYDVGHGYAPQYSAMSGDLRGSLPVGIQSRLAEDVPYWPASNCYNYAEVWVHPSSRWLGVLANLITPGRGIEGR